MGIPVGSSLDFNVLPLRAYHLIWDEWFRDQNLQDSLSPVVDDTGGIITTGWDDLNKRGKRHDYFTSCLPWTQKGDAVTVPIGTTAPIVGFGVEAGGTDTAGSLTVDETDNVAQTYTAYFGAGPSWPAGQDFIIETDGSDTPQIYADLSSATGSTINSWRTAFQVQKFLERDARGGTRMNEKIYSHFGVTVPDFRLQRPEYLGGSSQPIQVHPVPQTTSTDATTPQGNLSGFGTVSERNSGYNKSFTEHGYIISLANVRGELSYSQGLDKMWSRSTQYDFYWPSFSHLGEQAVLNKEIFADGTATDEDVFGYQERYAEYRFSPSKITGAFRPSHSTSLDPWHLSEEFATLPLLDDTFIQSNTPVDRCIAVPAEPHIILDAYFDLNCVRPMPVYSPPGLIDHF